MFGQVAVSLSDLGAVRLSQKAVLLGRVQQSQIQTKVSAIFLGFGLGHFFFDHVVHLWVEQSRAKFSFQDFDILRKI